MSDIHELKADPTPFEDVYSGRKTAEVRLDDRGYKVGDVLHLREHQRSGLVGGKYTGRELRRRVTHIQHGYGLPEGVVVLSLGSRPSPDQSRRADPIRAVVQAAVDLMEAREWAEHFADCHAPGDELAMRLESCITDLHNEAYGGEDREQSHEARDASALGREE